MPSDSISQRPVSRPLDRLLATDHASATFNASLFPQSRSFSRRARSLILIACLLLLASTFISASFYSYAPFSGFVPSFQHPSTQSAAAAVGFGTYNDDVGRYHALAYTTTVTVTLSSHPAEETPTTGQDPATSSQPPQPPYPEPVAFALIAWSETSGAEATLLIKTILMYITGPVEFHIICDSAAKDVISKALDLVTSPTYDIQVRYYMPTWEQMAQRIEREGTLFSEHKSGTPGLMKLFLHEIIPVDKVIYVDTDTIFISDPRHLWNVFSQLKPQTYIVMSRHDDAGTEEWHNADKICSCVMLLNLRQLRQIRLMDSSVYRIAKIEPAAAAPVAFRALFGDPDPEDGRYHHVRLGDQGFWWAIVNHFEQWYEPLSFDYEVSSCLFEMYETRLGDTEVDDQTAVHQQGHVINTFQHGKVIRPKLLHFNCLHGTDKWWEWQGWNNPDEKLNVQWGSAVHYHAGYKWIWLNRGPFHGSTHPPRVDSKLMETSFTDEIFAQENGLGHLIG